MTQDFRFCPRCSTPRTDDLPYCSSCSYAFPQPSSMGDEVDEPRPTSSSVATKSGPRAKRAPRRPKNDAPPILVVEESPLPAAPAKAASPACGCLTLVGLAVLVVVAFNWVTAGTGAPAEWAAVACDSYSDIVATGSHLSSLSDGIAQDDQRRIANELSATDELALAVMDRIGNLDSTWDRGDAWLTDLGIVASNLHATTITFREWTETGDQASLDQAIDAMAAAKDLLGSVNDRYSALGLDCPPR